MSRILEELSNLIATQESSVPRAPEVSLFPRNWVYKASLTRRSAGRDLHVSTASYLALKASATACISASRFAWYAQIARVDRISIERARQFEQNALDAVARTTTKAGTASARLAVLVRAAIAPDRPDVVGRVDRLATLLFPTGKRAARAATVARLAGLNDLAIWLRRRQSLP